MADPFQTAALDALDVGRSVLVVAPTGSGKTLIADYAIDQALAVGRGAVYTTPLKALSNQKYRDLVGRLGRTRVGLITGDRAVNPTAPVLVMTTEVLRAMLYERAPAVADTAAVVLDEFHYLQDSERGAAWEEVVIHVPPSVALVCLSATIPDPVVVHRWIESTHGPTELVIAETRPVVLNHLYAIGNLAHTAPLLMPMLVDGQLNPTAELIDGPRHRQTRGEGLRVRDRRRPVAPGRRELIEHLADSGLLPGIWFVLSRAGCDRAVAACLEEGLSLTTEQQRREVRMIAADALAALSPGEQRALEAGTWQAGLEAGIAAHHGGLAPIQREVVERAFARGLVQVAFATETLALGVNLPARTVVIDKVTRGDGELLGAGEFAQLAGRAGRRGIDTIGHVVVPWSEQTPFHRVASLATAQLASLSSAFRVTPAMAANLVRTTDLAGARRAITGSLRHHLAEASAAHLAADLDTVSARLRLAEHEGDVEDPPEAPRASPAAGIEAALSELSPGDVVVDPARPATGRVAILAVRRRRGAIAVDGIRGDGRRVVLTPASLRSRPVVIGRVELPEWEPTVRGHARLAVDALRALTDPATALPTPPPPPRRTAPVAERRRLELSRERLAAAVGETTRGMTDELDAVLRVLRRRGHLRGWELTPGGMAVRRLFHASGLLVAECLMAGLFDGLDAPSLASAASWFTARSRGEAGPPTGFATSELRDRWVAVGELTRAVQHDEAAEGLVPTAHPEPGLGVPVHRWASGSDLDVALRGSGVPVGDLVREVRQVAELLEQVEVVSGGPARVAAEAVTALLRGGVVGDDGWLDQPPEPASGSRSRLSELMQ